MTELVDFLIEEIRMHQPRSLRGVCESRDVDPVRFDATADLYLQWAVAARGKDWISPMVNAFVQFSTGVNMAQARYERTGEYENKTFAECHAETYNQKEVMDNYLWGVYLTNFLWSHHMEISLFYQDRFLSKLNDGVSIIEIAPGHGGWGLMALHHLPRARLDGFDISPSSIDIASAISQGADLAGRAKYQIKDALALDELDSGIADVVICSFLVEHLENPGKLFQNISTLLKDNGRAFVTGAITAAQVDHIFEFKRESELIELAESHSLRLLECFSGSPQRTLPKAQYLPRSLAMSLQKSQFL